MNRKRLLRSDVYIRGSVEIRRELFQICRHLRTVMASKFSCGISENSKGVYFYSGSMSIQLEVMVILFTLFLEGEFESAIDSKGVRRRIEFPIPANSPS